MYVKPAPLPESVRALFNDPAQPAPSHFQVRDPVTKDLLPPEGREVPLTLFWVCRIRDGDVVEAEPPPAPQA